MEAVAAELGWMNRERRRARGQVMALLARDMQYGINTPGEGGGEDHGMEAMQKCPAYLLSWLLIALSAVASSGCGVTGSAGDEPVARPETGVVFLKSVGNKTSEGKDIQLEASAFCSLPWMLKHASNMRWGFTAELPDPVTADWEGVAGSMKGARPEEARRALEEGRLRYTLENLRSETDHLLHEEGADIESVPIVLVHAPVNSHGATAPTAQVSHIGVRLRKRMAVIDHLGCDLVAILDIQIPGRVGDVKLSEDGRPIDLRVAVLESLPVTHDPWSNVLGIWRVEEQGVASAVSRAERKSLTAAGAKWHIRVLSPASLIDTRTASEPSEHRDFSNLDSLPWDFGSATILQNRVSEVVKRWE